MILQYAIVGLAVVLALLYLARSVMVSWRSGGCQSDGCTGCNHNRAGACASPDALVQLRVPSPASAERRDGATRDAPRKMTKN